MADIMQTGGEKLNTETDNSEKPKSGKERSDTEKRKQKAKCNKENAKPENEKAKAEKEKAKAEKEKAKTEREKTKADKDKAKADKAKERAVLTARDNNVIASIAALANKSTYSTDEITINDDEDTTADDAIDNFNNSDVVASSLQLLGNYSANAVPSTPTSSPALIPLTPWPSTPSLCHTPEPSSSYHTPEPASSYHTPEPASSYHTPEPASSYHTPEPASSYHTPEPASSYHTPEPASSSYHTPEPVSSHSFSAPPSRHPSTAGKRPRQFHQQQQAAKRARNVSCQNCQQHLMTIAQQEAEIVRLQAIVGGSYEKPPRPGKVPPAIAARFKMIELSPAKGIFILPSHINTAKSKKSSSSAVTFLMSCFYSNQDMIGKNLTGYNNKESLDIDIVDSILDFGETLGGDRPSLKLRMRNKLTSVTTKAKH